jgi:hypothetical protein
MTHSQIENVYIIIIFIIFIYIFYLCINKNKLFSRTIFFIIFIFFLFFISRCIKYEAESRYQIEDSSEYKIELDDKVFNIHFLFDELYIETNILPEDYYILKNIKIIYKDSEIGIIEINKRINKLEYNNVLNIYKFKYSIKETLNDILDRKKMSYKLDTPYVETEFKIKIIIENNKSIKESEVMMDNVGIIYRRQGFSFTTF